jgi:CDP-glucose 4,6-dehydratase
MGTVHLLQAVRDAPDVRAIVAVTTDKVYDNPEQLAAFREIDPLGAFEPYGASKAACELAISAYRHSYFAGRLGLASVRAGNVIGGGDWAADRLVPDAVRAFSKGTALLLRQPQATRPWQHVLEPVKGYLMLAQQLYYEPEGWSEAWNFGPEAKDNRPVAWVADRLVALWNEGGASLAAWEPAEGASLKESRLLAVESTKANEKLRWRPSWDLEQGLERSLEWYLAWLRGENMLTLSRAQIKAYDALR